MSLGTARGVFVGGDGPAITHSLSRSLASSNCDYGTPAVKGTMTLI
jgi:hypothetical protein